MRASARGEFAQIVEESDRAYEEDIDTAAQLITQRREELRLVIIAGPSSSGKTTTTTKLGERLKSGAEPGHPQRGQLLFRPGAASQGRVRGL